MLEAPREFEVPVPWIWSDDGCDAHAVQVLPVPKAVTTGVRRLVVAGGTIQPGQSLVVTESAALVPELLDRVTVGPGRWLPGVRTCVSPWRNRRDDSAVGMAVERRMQAMTATLWRARDAKLRIPRAIALVETVDDHFGHGMLDLLHRLRAVQDLPDAWPIVVSERMPSNVVAWIRILCPSRDILRLRHHQLLRCDELVVPLENARLWIDPEQAGSVDPVPATIDPFAMKWLQDLGATASKERYRRLWIRRDRSPHSKVMGEMGLVAQARDRGFEDVFLQDMTLEQARRLLGEASHVIAPMASAVANLTLASPGLRVVQLTDEVTWVDRYGSLTWLEAIGHESALLVGRQRNSGFTVSPRALESVIDWLVR